MITKTNNKIKTLATFVLVLTGSLWFNYTQHNTNLTNTEEIKKLNNRIIELEKIKDSLKIISKEFKDYQIRKKAMDISGIDIPEKFKTKYIRKVFTECEKNNIPPRLAFRLIKKESNFNIRSKSNKGASGLFQIMPNTYRAYSKKLNINKHDELANIEVGIFYLKTLYNSFRREDKEDRWRLAILSYNYGIGRVGNNKQRFLGKEFDNYKYLNFITS